MKKKNPLGRKNESMRAFLVRYYGKRPSPSPGGGEQLPKEGVA